MININSISVIFVLVLAFFFNSGRLMAFLVGSEAFAPFYYLVGTCFVVLQYLPRKAGRLPRFVMPLACVITYAAVKLALGGVSSVLLDRSLLTEIFAISLLFIVTWFSGVFSSVISNFTEAVDELVIIKENEKVLQLEQAGSVIHAEMERSRRYNHPFSIIVFEPEHSSFKSAANSMLLDVQQSIVNNVVVGKMGKILNELTRGPDFVLFHKEKGRFVVVCPETTMENTESLVRRLHNSIKDQLGVKMTSGAATFPDESISFDELMSKAASSLDTKNEDIKLLVKRPHPVSSQR